MRAGFQIACQKKVNSTRQFKTDARACNAGSLAAEIAAFSNSEGGMLSIGVIWLKTGADKRRENSKDVLLRLFQLSDQFCADELPAKARIDKLDMLHS
ncbi:MAG: hypothetical protein ACYCYR_08195 [Desulfobulbaceae bacterium]|jgi:hypothetical protein